VLLLPPSSVFALLDPDTPLPPLEIRTHLGSEASMLQLEAEERALNARGVAYLPAVRLKRKS